MELNFLNIADEFERIILKNPRFLKLSQAQYELDQSLIKCINHPGYTMHTDFDLALCKYPKKQLVKYSEGIKTCLEFAHECITKGS